MNLDSKELQNNLDAVNENFDNELFAEFIQKYYIVINDDYGNVIFIPKDRIESMMNDLQKEEEEHVENISVDEDNNILIDGKSYDLEDRFNKLNESDKYDIIKECQISLEDFTLENIIDSLGVISDVLSVVCLIKNWEKMSDYQKVAAVVGVGIRMLSYTSKSMGQSGQIVNTLINIVGKIENNTITPTDCILFGVEISTGMSLGSTRNFANKTVDLLSGNKVDMREYIENAVMTFFEIGAKFVPAFRVVILIYGIGNMIFDIFSKQKQQKILGIEMSYDIRFTWSMAFKCTIDNGFFDIHVIAYGHTFGGSKTAEQRAEESGKILPYKIIEIMGVLIQAVNEDPKSFYGNEN